MTTLGHEPPAWVYATSGDEQLDALGTWIWDLTADTVSCSDEAAAMAGLGAGRLDGDMGSFAAHFTSPSRRALRAAITEAVQQATPFRTWLELEHADGDATLVRISGRPFRDTNGHTVWVVGTLRQVDNEPDPQRPPVAAAAADPEAAWAEPHDRRSAVAAYRHVSHLI